MNARAACDRFALGQLVVAVLAGRAAAAGPKGEARRGRRAEGSGTAGGGAKRRP